MATGSKPAARKPRRGAAPGERRGGRAPGTPNKITASIRQAIEGAFTTLGGESYLVRVGCRDPGTFCRLLGKLLPRDVTVELPPVELEVNEDYLDVARRIAYVLNVAAAHKAAAQSTAPT